MLAFDDAVRAMGATVLEPMLAPQWIRAVTDTRTLAAGDTFIALHGERFNGHDFIEEALAKGAAALILDDPQASPQTKTTCIVTDTLDAYMALAQLSRNGFHGRVVAITGSTGKTTTKHFTSQLLSTRYGARVAATPGNENNEIGVSKLLLNASNEAHDVLVVEMGARHPHDIATLTAVARPDISVLTNVGDAHLEIMGTPERLAAAKWAIFEREAQPVTNANDAVTRSRASTLKREAHWFLAGSSETPPLPDTRYTALFGRDRFVDMRDGFYRETGVQVGVPGDHNRANLAAAAAASLECDADFFSVAAALSTIELPQGRYERIEAAGLHFIYDAYNANAAGTIAALDAFAAEPAQRRLVLLSSMAEQGDDAAAFHRRVGAHVARSNIDIAVFGGDFANELCAGARDAGLQSERIARFATNAEGAAWLRAHGRAGDVVLLKGSRKYRLEEIIEALQS